MKVIHVRGPWEPVTVLAATMRRLLRLAWDGRDSQPRQDKGQPGVNLLESATEFLLTVELPGLKPQQIELDVAIDSIIIGCRRGSAFSTADDSFRRQERWMGEWSRQVQLPSPITPELASAEMERGVLSIRLAKVGNAKPRRVEVKTPTKRNE